jgi:hypothetical protein
MHLTWYWSIFEIIIDSRYLLLYIIGLLLIKLKLLLGVEVATLHHLSCKLLILWHRRLPVGVLLIDSLLECLLLLEWINSIYLVLIKIRFEKRLLLILLLLLKLCVGSLSLRI